MSEDYRSDPSLRLLGRYATGGVDPASGDDLQNYETSKLPNYALAWAAGTLLRFDRDDNTTASALVGTEPVTVKPNSGPGCWKAVSGAAFVAMGVAAVAQLDNVDIVVTGANEWSALPNSGWTALTPTSVQSPLWALDNTGTFTYTGPPARFLVDTTLTVLNATGANTQPIGIYTSIDGLGLGGTADFTSEARTTATLQLEQQISLSTIVQLSPPSDTLQTLFRSVNGDDYTLIRGLMRITPLSIV